MWHPAQLCSLLVKRPAAKTRDLNPPPYRPVPTQLGTGRNVIRGGAGTIKAWEKGSYGTKEDS